MTDYNPDDSVLDEQFAAGDKSDESMKEDNKGDSSPEHHPDAESTENEAPSGDQKVKPQNKRERKRNVEEVPGENDESELLPEEIEEHGEGIGLPPVDYSGYTKKDLVETLSLIIENRPPAEIRGDVERIKILFYKKLRSESEDRKAKFLEGGGKIEEYKIFVDPLEHRVKELLEKYKTRKTDYSKVQEAEKYENLKKKYDIIDKIKDLVNREESINKTFQEFRALQSEWHSIGVVPQTSLKDLWENYHHYVEIFYDYIKINKELRDLDLKKNLEAKVRLCERAEELILEPNAINAFRLLQDFHNQWREIGPVPQEAKNEIWERFKEATSKINKRHHEYFEKQKDDQRKNMDAKVALC